MSGTGGMGGADSPEGVRDAAGEENGAGASGVRTRGGHGQGFDALREAEAELRSAVRELRAGNDLLRRMLEIETVGVIFFDPAGDIFRANDAFLRMGGYTPEDMAAGRLHWERLTPPEFMEASRLAIAQLRTCGSTTPYEKQYFRKDGSRFWGLFAAKGLSEHEGVEFVLDITERKRLEAELRRREDEVRRALERQSNIADWLQGALRPALPGEMPPGLRVHSFYRPALEEASVGGDFYDVFPLGDGSRGDGRHALVVADLSGKGLAAAAQVATVRHMLRALLYQHVCEHGRPLSGTVSALNDMLAGHGLLTGFATLFVGVFDPPARALTFVNCGQEPGLLLSAGVGGGTVEEGTVEELGPTGPVLGGFPGAAFEERTVPLAPGDVLALFTDGLTEAGRSHKDMLGVSGVTSIFRASAERTNGPDGPDRPAGIVARMVAGVEEGVTPFGIRDDICLLVACAG